MMLDLRRSGTLKAIDLLVIETEQFTLAIEGDIDFSRYHRFIDEQDYTTWRFQWHYSEASIQVFDPRVGELVTFEPEKGYLPIFFENGRYTVIIQPKMTDKIFFYHEYKPFREAIKNRARMNVLSGTLHFQNEVGLTTFEIQSVDGKTLLEVTLEVFPTKLDYKKDYRALLYEVNEEIYNLAYHFIQRTYLRGSARIFKDPSLTEFYRLIQEHFFKYIKSIKQVENLPHHHLTKEYIEVHGSRLRRQDSVSRAYLRKNASRFVDVEQGLQLAGRTVMPLKGLLIKKQHTVDTNENRYVKWTMERILARIQHLARALKKSQFTYGGETYSDVLQIVNEMEEILRKLLVNPFWRNIGKLDRSVGSLVLQMAPGYREVYQIHTILSQSIMLQGEIYKMSIKDIATLYEYWTFLKLGQLIGRICEPLSQDIIRVNNEGLFVNLDTSKSSVSKYKHPVTGEEIILTYQYKGKSLPTGQQIPDTMLSIGKKGKDYYYQYIFDAKYRIEFEMGKIPGPKQDDINTMHRYRDAIVAHSGQVYERTSFGAYVLFPWGDVEGYKKHPLYRSIEKVNIGGLPFLPNATELVEEILYNLLNRSAEELQQEGILPIGTHDYFEYTEDEKTIVFSVTESTQLDVILKSRKLHVPCNVLPPEWDQVQSIALFVNSGVTTYVGIQELGQVQRFERIGDEVVFSIESWGTLYNCVESNNYHLAEPIIVSKNQLLDAKSFPELLLFSPNQRQTWNLIRQLGYEILVELDSKSVSQRSVIRNFIIGDFVIEADWENEHLFLANKVIDISNVLKSPYLIYQQLKSIFEHKIKNKS